MERETKNKYIKQAKPDQTRLSFNTYIVTEGVKEKEKTKQKNSL